MKRYIPTGNEIVSLPTINEQTVGIESLSFLSMTHKGMLEIRGSEDIPLIQPFIEQQTADGNYIALPLENCLWNRDCNWIPVLDSIAGDVTVKLTVLTPVEERGFAIQLVISSAKEMTIRMGLRGCWESVYHCINEEKPLNGEKHCYNSEWNQSLVFDYRCGAPLFAFAPMADQPISNSFQEKDGIIYYTLSREVRCQGTETVTFFWGLGFEEVAAATSAKEMLRRTWQWEYDKTVHWLKKRSHTMGTKCHTKIYNTNLFFCFFFSTGITLDTEELVCVTSRSSRYYVSAAYWDRDTLLWAFPAILDVDAEYARRILLYVFMRQSRNFGVHSRYIDGTVLEPGFELDELVAPLLALTSYIEATKDHALLQDRCVCDGIDMILKRLDSVKHPQVDLYETFLQPTDDERVYPYITYDNVLVWRALCKLSAVKPEKYGIYAEKAESVRQAIYEKCVFTGADGKSYFGWSVDLEGNHDIYDEPPGSLQLLPYYGFCDYENEIWKNTVEIIRSPEYPFSFFDRRIAEIGCPHAPYPWVLSLSNSLLCGYAEQGWKELMHMGMDNGIACESVDPDNGECTTGAAFATCAGFLCHSMKTAYTEGTL